MRSIGRITVGSSPDITMLSVPDIEPPNQSLPVSVAPGPDGNMWFTDRGSDYLGSVAPLIGSFDEFPIPKNSNRFSQGVVVLPSGELWFVESGLSKLGMVQISSLQLGSVNAVTEIQAGSSVANEVQKISADPNGNVWFTEPQSDKIARVNVSAVPITVDEFSVPTAKAQPNGIAPGPDGAMWFTETKGKNLGRIPFDAAPGTSPTEFAFGLFAPGGLVTGPDCNVWVTDSTSPRARIGQIKF
jgi:virginiamycin B lyase